MNLSYRVMSMKCRNFWATQLLLSLFGFTLIEFISNAFSYPQTLLPDWSTNKSWTKTQPWKCRLKANLAHVFNAISLSGWPKTSKLTLFSMVERRPTAATSVATQASMLLIWKPTCWFIVERSLLFANSATTPAQQLVPSRHTCSPTQERNLSAAHTVNTPAQQLLISRDTCSPIREKSLSAAHNVT